MNSQQQPNRAGAKCSATSAPASTVSIMPSDLLCRLTTNFYANKEQESEMFGKSQNENTDNHRVSASAHKMPRSAVASSAAPEASSTSSGLSIVGKIVGHGALTIFGQVEGELRAS